MTQNWKPAHILWVGDDSGLPELNAKLLLGSMVAVGCEDIAENPQIPRCFQDAERKRIHAEAGPKWIWNGARDSGHREMHQSLIIASEMGRLAGCRSVRRNYAALKVDELKGLIRGGGLGSPGKRRKGQLIELLTTRDEDDEEGSLPPVGYWPWERMVKCLQGTTDAIEDKTLIVFCWSGTPNMPWIHAVYEQLAALKARIRCYPDFGDLHESERKIGDIAALDHIAANTLDEIFQYRPETCFKPNNCTLPAPFVVKRTHSSGGENVELDPVGDQATRLRCRATPRRRRSPRISGESDKSRIIALKLPRETLLYMQTSTPIWFHQAKVPSLINYGEFRLIIVTLPDETGLRGSRGAVFEAFHTIPRAGRPSEPLVSVMNRVPAALLNAEHCGSRTYQDLEDFALWVFEELRGFGSTASASARSISEPSSQGGTLAAGKRSLTGEEPSSRRSKSPRLSIELNATAVATTEPDKISSGETSPLSSVPSSFSPTPRRTSPRAPSFSPLTPPGGFPLSDPPSSLDGTSSSSAAEPSARKTIFSSLEVGVRLDIGISSKEDGHRFFVNEVTREWYGDLISFKSGEPRTRICVALGEARARVLFGTADEEDDPEGSDAVGDDGENEDAEGEDDVVADADPVQEVADGVNTDAEETQISEAVIDSGMLDIDRLDSGV